MGSPDDAVTISDVAPATSTQQVTGFIDDAAVVPASLPELREPEDASIAASMEVRSHSIIDVLSRPTIVSEFEWNDGIAQAAELDDIVFPQRLFDASPNIEDKLNYFTYLRADVCIRVVVNANSFQAGKLLGYFSPFQEIVGNRNVATGFLSSYSAFPHVLMDASTGNVAELRIPYVSPYTSYRLIDKVGAIGTFRILCLNPLKTGTCNVTVYAWFTNISVDLPSGVENTLTTNSEQITALKRNLKAAAKEKLAKKNERFIAQVGGEELKKSKVISSTLDTVSQIASVASGVPVLGQVAAPIAWVSKFGAKIAEYFGYSKSSNMSTPCLMTQIPGKNFTSANGVDSGVILATSVENAVEPRNDVFGSSIDDMDINYICKHRCYVDSFTMDTTQNSGTLLYQFPVTPGWCKFKLGVFRPTLTAFVASMFQLWRGGLRFKIQAAKTAYHSGRIRIVYLPSSRDGTVDDPEQAYNWVLDLRNSSEIEFTIPYNNFIEWTKCTLVDSVVDAGDTALGVVRIEVLNSLRAPDSVTSEIDLNVWLAGESDLQFAIPSFQNYVPSLPDSANRDSGVIPRSRRRPIIEDEKFIAQVLGTQQDRGFNDMEDKPQLFQMAVPDKVHPCKTSIGEIITNLRYLTRRFSYYRVYSSTVNLNVDIPLYYFGNLYDPSQPAADYTIPPIDYISFIYRFFRGGLRFKFMKDASDLAGSLGYQEAILLTGLEANSVPTLVDDSIFNRFKTAASPFFHRVYSLINPILEVTTPFFSQTMIRPIVGTDQSQPSNLEANSLLYRSTGDNSAVTILKAASDDFTFGWIVGPPFLRKRTAEVVEVDITNTAPLDEGDQLFIAGGQTTSFVDPGQYTIVSAVPATIDVTNQDLTTQQITPVTCTIGTDGGVIIRANKSDPTKTVDANQAQIDLAAVGTWSFVLR